MSAEPAGSGWVDVNVHYGPDVVDRSQTAREAVAQAIGIGCAAICLRSHAGSSVDLANALDAEAGDALRVFGGITLNRPVGGLNLDAVDVALATGARVVALPTWDAAAEPTPPRPREAPIRLMHDGRATRALTDVLARVAEADACMDLGPVAADELLPLVTAARSAGVRRVVVSHPFYPAQDYPDELVVAAAGAGAMVEHCAMQFRPGYPDGPPLHRLVDQIRAIGPASVVASSDSGKAGFPAVAECLLRFREQLAPSFDDDELALMFAHNPAWLLTEPGLRPVPKEKDPA